MKNTAVASFKHPDLMAFGLNIMKFKWQLYKPGFMNPSLTLVLTTQLLKLHQKNSSGKV